MKVLIIRLSALGDIVHGLPAAAHLKRRLPGLRLSWLVEPAGIPLLTGNPAVDSVISFPKKKWLQQLRSVSKLGATALEASAFLKELRTPQFDAAIDFQGLLKSGLLAAGSGAPRRIGFKGTREGAERFLTHALDVGDYFGSGTHVVEHNLRLAEYASRLLLNEPSDNSDSRIPSYINDGLDFPLPTPDEQRMEKAKGLLGKESGEEGVVFIPGTTWPSKIWPAEHWTRLGKLCLERFPGRLLLLGADLEKESNAKLASELGERVIDLSGKTDILDLIAIFQLAKLVVGADTGPLHLAAACGKAATLGIFGSTPSGRNGPYGKKAESIQLSLECQPCFMKVCPLKTLACLKELSPEQVFEKICRLV